MTNKGLHIEKKEFSYKMEQSEKQNIIDNSNYVEECYYYLENFYN